MFQFLKIKNEMEIFNFKIKKEKIIKKKRSGRDILKMQNVLGICIKL